jgi:transcriptional regulator GlxA family with amidase domain
MSTSRPSPTTIDPLKGARACVKLAVIDPRVRRVADLMHCKLDRKLQVSQLAGTVALSASRLRHLFKNQLGASPTHYLKSLRMHQAERLLETSALSVKEIAACLSYGDPSRFVEDFRKTLGLSPLRYRVRFSQSNVASSEDQSIWHTNSRIGM